MVQTKPKVEHKNALPKRYRTNFIEPGLVDYNAEGFGTVLVEKDALDRMLPSFVGKPVFLEHQDVDPEEAFSNSGTDSDASGVVSDVGYDEKTGWYYADMMIWDAETQKKLDNGWTVSCAYDVGEADGKGGTYHNIRYNQSVLDGEYTHMAIVNNPRYEKATVLQNAKGASKMKIFKFLKNEAPAETEKKKEDEAEVMNADDAMVDLGDGNQIPLSELVAAYKETKAEESEMMNAEDKVDVDGEEVSVGDLINAYKTKNAPVENAEPPQDVVAEPVVDEKKQKVQNSNFKKVENAVKMDAEPAKPNVNMRSERLERGTSRYSSKKEGVK